MRWLKQLTPAVAILIAGWGVDTAYAFEAGAAKVDITPPVGTPLSGYWDRMGRSSTGVHDPLWSRALYLDDGQTQVVLVNVDLCAIDRELRTRVLELSTLEIAKENIILAATHTHNGAGGMCPRYPIRAISGRFLPDVLESTARGIVQSIQDAFQNRRRAAIGFGTGNQLDLSSNRRHAGGPTDPQIGVIDVEDADGNPIAAVTNFTAHPTSIGDESHYVFSADYPGFYYTELEGLLGAGAVALFFNGAEGNQTVGNPEKKDGWDRTASVGRLLAERVKQVLDKISCGEGKLHVGYGTPDLPLTIAPFQPRSVIMQTLEINDLLLTFLPGEACVEVALALRQQAQARGYQAQFTVGLANDYLMYFNPRAFYSDSNYEAAISFYGPGIEDWIYREFGRLMTKGEAAPASTEIPMAEAKEVEGGRYLTLYGTPYSMGVQRGKLFAEDLRSRYQDRVFQPIATGAYLPSSGLWSNWPSFLDPTPLALSVMAISARPLLKGVSAAAFQEIEGMADGAGMPFDALWMLQNAHLYAAQEDKSVLFETPLCTMFASLGDRAGGEDLIIGRNMDWAGTETPVILELHPEGGKSYVQVGFTWNTGVFTGMNEAGLVVCAERIVGGTPPPFKGPSLEMTLREILESAEQYTPAVALLQSRTHLRGYRVLVAGWDTKGGPKASVVSFGNQVMVTPAANGLLMGVDPAANGLDEATADRYGRLAGLLQNERILGRREIQQMLADQEPEKAGLSRIWNEQTTHSVVFEPKKRIVHVAFRGSGGGPGKYTAVSLKGGADHE